MKYQIVIKRQALSDIEYFKKTNKIIAKKIQNLLIALLKDSFSGVGKPEPLRFELSGYWSGKITREHRLIYSVTDEKIIVISCRYHY